MRILHETLEDLDGVMISKKQAVKIIKKHSCLDELNDFWFNYGIKEKYNAYDVYCWLGY
jgi:hypothetical protein